MTDKEKIINIEHFIKLKDLIKLIITNLFFFKKYENYFSKNAFIEGLNFRNEIESLYNASLINRAKLEIYANAIPRFLNFYNIKKLIFTCLSITLVSFNPEALENIQKQLKL